MTGMPLERDQKQRAAAPLNFVELQKQLYTAEKARPLAEVHRTDFHIEKPIQVKVSIDSINELAKQILDVPLVRGIFDQSVDLSKILLPEKMVEAICKEGSEYRIHEVYEKPVPYTGDPGDEEGIDDHDEQEKARVERNEAHKRVIDGLVQAFQKSRSLQDLANYLGYLFNVPAMMQKVKIAWARTFTGIVPENEQGEAHFAPFFNLQIPDRRFLYVTWNSDGSNFGMGFRTCDQDTFNFQLANRFEGDRTFWKVVSIRDKDFKDLPPQQQKDVENECVNAAFFFVRNVPAAAPQSVHYGERTRSSGSATHGHIQAGHTVAGNTVQILQKGTLTVTGRCELLATTLFRFQAVPVANPKQGCYERTPQEMLDFANERTGHGERALAACATSQADIEAARRAQSNTCNVM